MKQFLILCFILSAGFAHAMSLKDYLAQPANPMKIKVALDNKEKVSELIEAKAGGTLLLKTTGGDSFELTIPPGALMRDTTITLQKIKSVKHSNLSTTAQYTGVEIFPDGMDLKTTATLTIKTKNEFPLSTLTAFTAEGSGDETHIAHLVSAPSTREFKIGLLHFSNYSVTNDPSADELISQLFTKNEITRIASWTNGQLLKAVQEGDSGREVLEKAFKETFNSAILPSILRANSCDSGSFALQGWMGWARQVVLAGDEPEKYYPPGFKTDLGTMIHDVGEMCLELAKKACYMDHQPLRAAIYTLSLERAAALVGEEELMSKITKFRNKCLTFKFFMESEMWVGETRAESHGKTARSEFSFKLDPFYDEDIKGELRVESSYYNNPYANCTQTVFQSDPVTIYLKNFLYNVKASADKLDVSLGGMWPISYANYSCRVGSETHDVEFPAGRAGSYWGGFFLLTHGPMATNELDMKTGMFKLRDWTVRNDVNFLTKEYSQTVQGPTNESTQMIIYHTPEPL